MTQQASTQSFRGSDTDALDKIVNKMTEAADFADKMVMALKALCAALDAISWTGYAAALAAYLRGTVIPLLQTVSRNLKLFAKFVGMASSIQKDTSSNRYVIDAGDTGYVPVPISRPAPPVVRDPATPVDEHPDSGSDQGAVDANTLDIDKLKTVVGDIATIYNKVRELAELADGDGIGDGTISQQLTKLGEVVGAIEKLIGDVNGDGGDDSGTGADGGGDSGTGGDIDSGTGSDIDPGTGSDIDPGTGRDVDAGTGSDTGTGGPGAGDSAGSGVTVGQIWQAITGALRELGLLSGDGTVTDTGSVGFDSDAVAGEIDSIQSSLDNLRESLGIEGGAADLDDMVVYPTDTGPNPEVGLAAASFATEPGFADSGTLSEPSFHAADSASSPTFDTATDSDSGYDSGYSAGYEAGYSVGAEDSFAEPAPMAAESQAYQAEPGLADSGGGASGGGGSDPGSGSGGGTGGGTGGGSEGSGGGSYAPEQAAAQGPTSEQEQVVYHSRTVGSVGEAAGPAPSGEVQSRLVAMASEPTSSAGAAIPLSGAAVAASLLGGMYARRSRGEEAESEQAQEEFAAAENPS